MRAICCHGNQSSDPLQLKSGELKTACLGLNNSVFDARVTHTTTLAKVSVSLTKLPFLFVQVSFHTS